MPRTFRTVLMATTLVAAACSSAPTATPPTTPTSSSTVVVGDPVVGAAGLGDPYFPELGNGGYDVGHYDLRLGWFPDGDEPHLSGHATISLTPLVPLAAFNLDLAPFDIAAVTIDGTPVAYAHDGHHELTITPDTPLTPAVPVAVVVDYDGTPTPVDTGTDVFDVGWNTLGRGAYVSSEPAGAATWFPANDHPSDKATFLVTVDVPDDLVAVANGTGGRLEDPDGAGAGPGRARWRWDMPDPMATYLATLAIGDFVIDESATPDGILIRNVFPTRLAEDAAVDFAATADLIALFQDWFGPYPFDVYGQVVVDTSLGFALENQTLSLFGADFVTGGAEVDDVIAHELAHQWFGDSVSPATWQDIWLNEGFATFAEWIWLDETGRRSIARSAEIAHGTANVGVAPGDPGPEELFQASPYIRGALALYAVYDVLGEEGFRTLLHRWAGEYGGGTATTADLEALASELAGRDLDDLFAAWVYDPVLPPLPAR